MFLPLVAMDASVADTLYVMVEPRAISGITETHSQVTCAQEETVPFVGIMLLTMIAPVRRFDVSCVPLEVRLFSAPNVLEEVAP